MCYLEFHTPNTSPSSPFFGQQTKERVKLLIQLADGFCEKGHSHSAEIKKWVTAVDKRYRDFSLRMDKYRCSLEKALGISSDSNKAVSCPEFIWSTTRAMRTSLTDSTTLSLSLCDRTKTFSWTSSQPQLRGRRLNYGMPPTS